MNFYGKANDFEYYVYRVFATALWSTFSEKSGKANEQILYTAIVQDEWTTRWVILLNEVGYWKDEFIDRETRGHKV